MKKVIDNEQTKSSRTHADRIYYGPVSIFKNEMADEKGSTRNPSTTKIRVYHPKMMIVYRHNKSIIRNID